MQFLAYFYVWNSSSWNSTCPGASVNTLKSPAWRTSQLHEGTGAEVLSLASSQASADPQLDTSPVSMPSQEASLNRRELPPNCALSEFGAHKIATSRKMVAI